MHECSIENRYKSTKTCHCLINAKFEEKKNVNILYIDHDIEFKEQEMSEAFPSSLSELWHRKSEKLGGGLTIVNKGSCSSNPR